MDMQELERQLAELRERGRSSASPEMAQAVADQIAQLAAARIADRSLRKGATAPDFSLPNVRGVQVRLYDLLGKGPVVLAFYRGGW